jgi:glutathione S-transferase
MADCCLIPQPYKARRFGCDLSAYPAIAAIDARCAALPAFRDARPELQPDAE